jgi:hypothetical protein
MVAVGRDIDRYSDRTSKSEGIRDTGVPRVPPVLVAQN